MKNFDDFPLISIITVCRNAVAYIQQTILSVLSQTYPRKEYIIIDGGSTDGTVDVIRRYAADLAYWHTRPDRGLAHAFNLGLAQARGDWLVYLNADDYFAAATAVEQMVPHLQRHPQADVIYGQARIVGSRQDLQAFPFDLTLGRPWSWDTCRWYNIIPHQAAFTSHQYFARLGPFDEEFAIAVDYEHFLRGGRELQAVFVPLTVSHMRLGGMSNTRLRQSWREYRRAQIKTRALSPGQAWVNYAYRLLSYYLKRSARKVLASYSGSEK